MGVGAPFEKTIPQVQRLYRLFRVNSIVNLSFSWSVLRTNSCIIRSGSSDRETGVRRGRGSRQRPDRRSRDSDSGRCYTYAPCAPPRSGGPQGDRAAAERFSMEFTTKTAGKKDRTAESSLATRAHTHRGAVSRRPRSPETSSATASSRPATPHRPRGPGRSRRQQRATRRRPRARAGVQSRAG